MYNVLWKNYAKNVDKLIVTERKLVGLSAIVGSAKKNQVANVEQIVKTI